mmetsp:Transcript_5050/g.13445  ORF Transcript_5050/g.13445 Transcript_5050/m.13445 type:complete len:238 (+) Transcript_5050:457-1170(+)
MLHQVPIDEVIVREQFGDDHLDWCGCSREDVHVRKASDQQFILRVQDSQSQAAGSEVFGDRPDHVDVVSQVVVECMQDRSERSRIASALLLPVNRQSVALVHDEMHVSFATPFRCILNCLRSVHDPQRIVRIGEEKEFGIVAVLFCFVESVAQVGRCGSVCSIDDTEAKGFNASHHRHGVIKCCIVRGWDQARILQRTPSIKIRLGICVIVVVIGTITTIVFVTVLVPCMLAAVAAQ